MKNLGLEVVQTLDVPISVFSDGPDRIATVAQVALADLNADKTVDFVMSINSKGFGAGPNGGGPKTEIKPVIAAENGFEFLPIAAMVEPNHFYQTSNILSFDANKDGLSDFVLSGSGGDTDFASSTTGAKQKLFLSNLETGTYSEVQSPQMSYIHNGMVGDLTNDGYPDIYFFATAVGNSILAIYDPSQRRYVFTQEGLDGPALYGENSDNWEILSYHEDGWLKDVRGFHQHNSAITDVDRDGDNDLVLFYAGDTVGHVYFNNIDPVTNLPDFTQQARAEFDFTIAELSASGNRFTFVGELGEQKTLVLRKQGLNPYETVKFDVDGDGWEDILVVSTWDNIYEIGGVTQPGFDGYVSNGTYYQVLLSHPDGLVNESDFRVSNPPTEGEFGEKDSLFTMFSKIDFDGDGDVDFLSNGATTSRYGFNDHYWNQYSRSWTHFMENNGEGRFEEVFIEGLEWGSFNVVPIDGKLGFFHTQLPSKHVSGPDDVVRYTFLKSEIPWTKGGSDSDFIYGTPINDVLIGGGGVDIYQPFGRSDRFAIEATADGFSLSDREGLLGLDQLKTVERIHFYDKKLAIDLSGSAGQVSKTLAAVIGEEGLSNKEYVGIGLQLFDAGQSLATVCELALTAVGATTNEEVVNLLYTNLYSEAPTADVAQPFIDALNNGGFTKGSLAAAAAELTDDLGVIDLVGLAETGIEYV